MQTFMFTQLGMADIMDRNKVVMMDTCFFIRMSNANDPLHNNAREYFKHLLQTIYSIGQAHTLAHYAIARRHF